VNFKEFVLGFINNAHWLFLVAGIVFSVFAAIFFVFFAMMSEERPNDKALPTVKYLAKFGAITAVSSWLAFCLPRTGDMWEVRVDLIKLAVASPENIKLGIGRVNQIADEMECKYTGNKCQPGVRK
jgi:hypothetical protein